MTANELISVLLPALAAGLIVISTHIVLGRQVLQRGIVFIDLAIAQIASLGVVISHLMTDGSAETSLPQQLLPYVFSLSASLFIAYLAHYIEHELEAIIGCIYVVSAAAVLLVLTHNPYGAEQIERSLAGHIFWISGIDLLIPSCISLLFFLLIFCMPQLQQSWLFYPIFAVIVTMSVELVGVYLVFSSLIMPALGTINIPGKNGVSMACILGATGYLVGLIAACYLDLPGGASTVISLAGVCLLFRLFSKKIPNVNV